MIATISANNQQIIDIRNIIRYLRQIAYRFRYIFIIITTIYGFIIMLPDDLINYKLRRKEIDKSNNLLMELSINNHNKLQRSNDGKINKQKSNLPINTNAIPLYSSEHGIIMIENIVGENPDEIYRRFIPPKNIGNDVKIIELSYGITQISNVNMGGCKEWQCIIRIRKSNIIIPTAEAILINSLKERYHRYPNQYYIFFTQESAANYPTDDLSFNLSLNFIRNSPISSPYGYAVKLAKASKPIGSLINDDIIQNKTKPIAWFVSNCKTASQREIYVNYLKKYLTVDIFGSCGDLYCADSNASCEKQLDNVYYFYLAFENSICDDYITEKLWKHGYGHDVIPIILKRSIVERYVPPYSFIAVDDFTTVHDLADYLKYLMHNLSAYKEYFEWRREYKVFFLDGNNHDQLERPWGFCQLCRLLWLNPRPKYVIENFADFWNNSCELSGTLFYVSGKEPQSSRN
ncbi:Alpha-(1,3)-fucosyltransferase fut-1 [Dirofilaria immitis]